MRARLEADFERFRRALPRDFAAHVREAYAIDLTARYLGEEIPHPVGKGSGQLSLNESQLEADAAAGLAFAVLKTVIAQDEAGGQSMAAWAIHETKMTVERRNGWTVTWKGRGWDRSFAEYLALVRAGRDLTRAGRLLVVPSVKYHLPRLGEPFREGEYGYTTQALAEAWGKAEPPLLLEKDFSPTLAGDALADDRAQILRWLREVPERIRAASPIPVRLAMKLMNARFDDAFQVEMVEAARGADALVVFNRLFDVKLGVAYGGGDLSDRNLRVLDCLTPGASPGSLGSEGALIPGSVGPPTSGSVGPPTSGSVGPPTSGSVGPPTSGTPGLRPGSGHPDLCGTGNVHSGRMIVEYARRGCAAVQLHTFFQLPPEEYPATDGSRTARALHALIFEPRDGLVACLLELEAQGALERRGGELHVLDLVNDAHRPH